MFYSQFILAKKGPLGTIWIAAHLERKLRKNQVADTDIGVSVDSILFPDVPIALRLSSHLLLGVVRIYSRKVNYLFSDCSEALLKIKQAFRSTIVDLPPEESTAPYHSITLPETFDLDDFELPDSAFLNGNFVDYHVSTTEQITLQDTVEATGYSSSKFGLDERFGDGDASQISLDLDEDILLDKITLPHHTSPLLGTQDEVEPQISGQPETPFTNMDIDDQKNDDGEDKNAEIPNDMPENSVDLGSSILSNAEGPRRDDSSHLPEYNIQTLDVNEVVFPSEHVEGPSAVVDLPLSCPDKGIQSSFLIERELALPTPCLMQEAITANVQEIPALSPHEKTSSSNGVVCPVSTNECGIVPVPPMDLKFSELPQAISSPVSTGPKLVAPGHQFSDGSLAVTIKALPKSGQKSAAISQIKFVHNDAGVIESQEEVLFDTVVNFDLSANNKDVARGSPELNGDLPKGKSESHPPSSQNPEGIVDSWLSADALAINSGYTLRSCSLQLNQNNVTSLDDGACELLPKETGLGTTEVVGKEELLHAGGSSVEVQDLNLNQKPEHVHSKYKSLGNKPQELSTDIIAEDSRLEILNCSASSEYPEPERMLLAPTENLHLTNDVGQCTTEKGVTESDGSVDRIKGVRGKKRHLAESMAVLQAGSSVKLVGAPQLGGNSDYIPDDDDLLASILVGRSSALKLKPTPSLPTVASSKRARLTGRVGFAKRKVLLDDTMVLHADAMRQQLINTEVIRRIRKKAPCTHTEIWMIHKCLLEDEIFTEPLLTGVSTKLMVLHSQRYDLDETRAFQVNASHSRFELSKAESRLEKMDNSIAVVLEKNDGGSLEPSDAFQCGEVQPSSLGCDAQEQTEMLPNATQLNSSNFGQEFPSISMELDVHDSRDEVTINFNAQAPLFSAPHPRNECDIPADSRSGMSFANKDNEKVASSQMKDKSLILEEQNLLQEPVQSFEGLGEMVDKSHCLSMNTKDTGPRADILVCAEDAFISKDSSTMGETISGDAATLNCPQDYDAKACEIVHDEALILIEDNCTIDVEADSARETSTMGRNANNSISDVDMENNQLIHMATVMGGLTMEQFGEDKQDVGADDGAVAERMRDVEGNPASEIISLEHYHVASSGPLQPNTAAEDVPSTVGENSGFQESNLESAIDVEITHFSFPALKDSSDFCSAIVGNDTEFLNVDDDEAYFDDEVDNDVPNAEEGQSLENSGWSSRTRGVARYLKSLFDDESGHGRKIVDLDRLLVGKTRKEASRMFFETLVLKTKDYIHVEQENPFENVSIRPRAKLLKSEF